MKTKKIEKKEIKTEESVPETYTIDARDKKIGRVATDAASHLLGKHRTSFVKNAVRNISVSIVNASALDIHPRKMAQKMYVRYTGYPGGLINESMPDAIKRHGFSELLRRAIYNMLPPNKLRVERMKNLTISE